MCERFAPVGGRHERIVSLSENPEAAAGGEGAGKTRGRNTKRNLALVLLGLGYALYTHDVPLLIAAVSILLFFLQPLAEKYLGSFGKATSGFLRGIGIALFIGAIAMLFL